MAIFRSFLYVYQRVRDPTWHLRHDLPGGQPFVGFSRIFPPGFGSAMQEKNPNLDGFALSIGNDFTFFSYVIYVYEIHL